MKTKKAGKRGNIFVRNTYCFVSAIISAVIMLFIYCVWQFTPIGDKIILRMDLYHQYAPLFAELYERIFGGASLTYSFTSGLGSGFLGNYFNYLSSPTLLFVLIFGHKNVPEAIAAMVLVKACISAYTFTYFLGKISKKSTLATSAFGLFYAFSGYFVAYYWNVMWLDAMAIFPLVMLGIYYILNDGKPLMYILSLGYIMMTNYYMAYMTCLLSVIMFIYMYASGFKSDKLYNDIILKSKYKHAFMPGIMNSRFLTRGFMFALSSVMAFMLAAFALVPVYMILQHSSATSSSFPTTFSTNFSIFDFLANHLAGVTPTIRSSGDTVYPNIYCGIITLVLVPLFMFSKKFSVKEKIATVAVLGIFFFSFNINYLNFIWHGFHFPNDLPYRFSFAYSFFLLFIAYKVFTVIDDISPKSILGSAISVAMFAAVVEKVGSANVTMTTVWVSVIFAAVYAVVLIFLKQPKYAKQSISILLITAVCAELIISDTGNFVVTQSKDAYTSSYDVTEDVIGHIKGSDSETDGFYRMELASLLTRMDNCWFYYNGVSTFTSMAYEKVSNLQQYLGLYGNKINSYTYNCQTGLYNSMMSLKYIIDNHDYVSTDSYVPRMENNFLYTKYYTSSGMTAYKNNYWLPVAFSADNGLDENWAYNGSNPFAVQNDFFYNASGVSDILVPLKGTVTDRSNFDEVSDEEINSGVINVYKENANSADNEMTIDFTVEKTQNIYVYFACRDVDSIFVSAGDFNYNQNVDTKPYVLDLGKIEAGTPVSVTFSIGDDSSSDQINLYAVGLDEEKFISAYNTIQKNGTLEVTENKESYIKGTINLAKGKMLYTSIPYDKGWSVYVDGAKVDSANIVKIGDALMGVYMDAGEHTVEFKFNQPGLLVGIAVTFVGILLLAVLEILKKKKRFVFSPAMKSDFVELGRWRDGFAEDEAVQAEKDKEDELLAMIEKAQNDDIFTTASDGPWQSALKEAEDYARNQAKIQDDAEAALEAFEEAGAEAVPDTADDITTEEELENFEKSTDDMENIKKHVAPPTEKKTAQKKRLELIIGIVVLLVIVLVACGIMIKSALNSAEAETTDSTSSTSTTEVTTKATTTAKATTAATTTQSTTATTTTKPVTTTEVTTAATTVTTTAATTSSYNGAYVTYTVKSGDNFYKILRDNGVADTPANVEKMCAFNGISVTSGLSVGQTILVPTE